MLRGAIKHLERDPSVRLWGFHYSGAISGSGSGRKAG
jgi:hypothetical protein